MRRSLIAVAFTAALSGCGGGTSTPVMGPAGNGAPTADAGNDLTMSGGGAVTLDGSASLDPEGGALTFAWAQVGGSPTVALDGANTAAAAFTTPQVTADTDLTFRLTVTDPHGRSASDTVTVTVRAGNGAPIADAGSGRTVGEGAAVTLDGSASTGPEGGALAFAWAQVGGSPTVALAGANTVAAAFTAPRVAADADLTFRLTVTDPHGRSASDTVTVTVRAGREGPTANTGNDRSVDDGGSVTLDGSASTDPEGGALTFAWAQVGGSPTVALVGANTAAATFTSPQVTEDTRLTFRLTVTDSGGRAASRTVTVTVRAVNDPPTVNAGGDRSVDDGGSVTLDGSASTDPEGGALAFAWAQVGGSPTVALVGADTAAAAFTTPQVTEDTRLTFRLTVTDSHGLSASRTVTVTVRAVNDPPTADAGSDRSVTEGGTVTLDGSASTDPEGGALSFAWAQIGGSPTVALGGAGTATVIFAAPQVAEDADLTFRLTVTDPGGASASDTVTVTVRAVAGAAPIANAGADLTVDEGDPVTLDGSASTDPKGGALTFAWRQVGGTPRVALGGAGTASPTFSAPQLTADANLAFRLTVTDSQGVPASDTVIVTVRADDDAPTADAGADRTVDDGDPVTLDGSASTDPESGALTFAWAHTGGSPTVALDGAATASPTFSTPQLTAQTDLTFTLTVTDPGGLSATDTVTITVRADDDAPTADAGADRTTYEGDSVTLDGSGSSDPEGGTLTYGWAQSAGSPTATLSGASTATASFTAPTVTADADLTFTLTVSDPGGQSVTDTVTITVKNVRPATSAVRTPASGETLEPATAANTASSWETTEYTATKGLPLINASTGYAARTMGNPGGGGRTIALYDSRIHDSHPDLPGVTRVSVSGGTGTIGQHGTRVIGVAAARRDGTGMHGVAYNANIVEITRQADYHDLEAVFASAAGLTGAFSYPGHRWTFTADPAGSAHILILPTSLEGDPAPRLSVAGMRTMAGRGRIVVASTGNDGGSEPAGWPAKASADEGIAGFAIAASALNAAGTGQASWANRCGAVKQYCLMAPGYAYTTDRPTVADPTGLYTNATGTSFSAPYVAGAAAVLWAAFPNKTASQIVDRLLTTAQQIDTTNCAYDMTTGISARCGHGALDLGAAMNPMGFTSMSMPSGMVPVRGAVVRLPPGARVRADPVLADAVVYDEQGFPFLHDLNGHFLAGGEGASPGSVLDGFLETGDREWSVMPLGDTAAFSFAGPAHGGAATAAERAWSAHGSSFDESSLHEPMRDYRLSFQPRPGLALTVGRGAGAPALLNGFAALPGRWDLFQDGLSVRPFAAFAGQGLGVGADWQLGRTSLGFAARDGRSRFGAPRASLASLGLTRRFGGGLTANASWGMLHERGARLGMRSFGGFGAVPGTTTSFFDVSVEKTVFGGTVLFGSYSRGAAPAQAGKPDGLVRGWGEFRADALALGVEVPSVLVPSDRVTATLTAPFRPRGKVAQVLVPVREELDGVVDHALRTVGLASAGREVRAQLVYEAWSADDTALTLGGWTRFTPHDASSDGRDWGVAAKIRRDF